MGAFGADAVDTARDKRVHVDFHVRPEEPIMEKTEGGLGAAVPSGALMGDDAETEAQVSCVRYPYTTIVRGVLIITVGCNAHGDVVSMVDSMSLSCDDFTMRGQVGDIEVKSDIGREVGTGRLGGAPGGAARAWRR